MDPFFKPSVFEKYNITSYIWYSNDYPDVLINNTLSDIFDESTYHLNEDFTINIYIYEEYIYEKLNIGENQVKFKENLTLTFEVKKIRTEFHGNCYVILPKNEMLLTPGDKLIFYIKMSNTTKPEDRVVNMDFYFSTKVGIL